MGRKWTPRNKTRKKRLKGRERRLARAPNWVAVHRGKPVNMLKRYRKEFQVDWECAISELTALGISFRDDYLSALRKTIAKEFSDEKKHSPIRQADFDLYHGIESESDDFFAYIAGYTPGGAPFGITWEKVEESERRGEHVDFGQDSPSTGYDGKKKPSVEEEVDFDSEKLDGPRTIKSSVPRRP